ncbi:hypothetical protein L596_011078 [Steinernema carpocapsae]|uniref:Uncharacterized protein n=1 Tax=Steinernema carpocapsae TaxID=34508 RepID=A0A4U5NTM4_STECR|nr:hypothetical protein L596_011078 [Steinernema carpocapsae]
MHIQVTIPADLNQNWPSLTGNLAGGITIEVKKLEQQYKVSVNHLHSRKPEFSIFIASLNHDHELKTVVKDLNTRLTYVAIGGPNMQVSGHLKADRLTLESTLGPLNINAKINVNKLSLNGQQLFVCPEAMIACHMIKVTSRKLKIDGKIFPSKEDSGEMRATFDVSLVHIGIDGTIGTLKGREPGRPTTPCHQRSSTPLSHHSDASVSEDLYINISGCLANHGKIVARRHLEVNVGGNLLTLEDGRIDSASRGFSAYRQINGIAARTSEEISPTSSRLSSAIDLQSPSAVAELLEQGVDKNDAIERSYCSVTPKRFALRRYKEISNVAQRNSQREKIFQISALFSIHDWRRGMISAPSILATVVRDCQDCAQFKAEKLELRVGQSAKSESDSIWSSGTVEMHVGKDLIIDGQVKHLSWNLDCVGNIITSGEAIVSEEESALITAKQFICDGIWTIAKTMTIEASELCQMTSNSYLETGELRVLGEKDVELNGTWQTGELEVEIGCDLKTLSNGKCLVEKSARVKADRFTSAGFWKVTDVLDLKLTASADFLQSSITESNLFKLIVLHNCTLGGNWMLGNLLTYIRNEFYTTPHGRCSLDVSGTLAVGSFQNHCQWQSEQNLHLFAGTIEQSQRALIFVKNTFNLSILGDSLKGWEGRIVAHSLVLKVNREVRFYGSIRVNEIEVTIPYVNESKLVNSGHIDVLVGPLILKGNSAFDNDPCEEGDLEPHPFPAFVLDGVLRSQAIVGPFLAVEISNQGSAHLSSLQSLLPQTPFNMLISVGALHTHQYSIVDSISSSGSKAEGIVCATRFIHEGQIRFGSDEVLIFVDQMLNDGRLTSTTKKAHNHMKEATLQVHNLLVNNAVISADHLSLVGEGRLVNKNRIFAVENLHIRLSNFSNDDGELESRESLRLLSSSTTAWSRIGGSISAPSKKVAIGGERIYIAARNLHKLIDEKNFISAKKDLRIATEMCDDSMTRVIGFSARDSINFEAPIKMEAVEIQIGELEDVSSILVEHSIIAHRVFITGNCKHLNLTLDGSIKCRKLVVKESIQSVTVTGSGSIECSEEIQIDGKEVTFAILNVFCSEIQSRTIRIAKNANVRITNPSVQLCSENLLFEGNLLIEGKMSVVSMKCSSKVSVRGNIIGTGARSELSLEADFLNLDGLFSNISFVEVLAHERLELESTFVLKNAVAFAVDSQRECAVDGTFSRCHNFFVNAEQLSVAGNFAENEKISFFANRIDFNAIVERSEKLVLNSNGSIYARGSISSTPVVELESKWLHLNSILDDITITSISSWSSVLQSTIRSSALKVRGLGVCLVSSKFNVDEAEFTIPFFMALESHVSRISRLSIRSLVSIYRQPEDIESVCNSSSLTFVFEPSEAGQKILTRREMDCWRLTCRQLKESFVSSATLRPNEILIGVKYFGEVDSVVIRLPPNGSFFESLQQIVSRFRSQQISGFNCSKLIDVLQRSQNAFLFSNDEEITVEKQKKKGKKRRSGSEEAGDKEKESLFEVIVSFKNAFEKLRRPSKMSTDSTDIGYASRSSSEDLEVSARGASPEKPKNLSLKQMKLKEEDVTAELSFQKALEECATECKAMCSPATADSANPMFTFDCAESLSEEDIASYDPETREEHLMDFVFCSGSRIPVLPINFEKFRGATCPPSPVIPIRTPSRHDLVMKKLQVKHNLSVIDLKSYSSVASLDSIDTTLGDMGTPMRFAPSPLRQSLIPRLSHFHPLPHDNSS